MVLKIFRRKTRRSRKQCHTCHGMEQSIPYSCYSLYVFGTNLYRKSKVHKFTFRLLLRLLIFGNLLSAVHRMVEHPRHGPLDIAIIFFVFGVAKASLAVLRTHNRIKNLFAMTISNLTEEERKEIKKFDQRLILGQWFVICHTLISLSAYTAMYGPKEMISFALGVNSSNETINDYYNVVAYVGPSQLYLLYMAFWNCGIYYILILLLVKTFASNSKTFTNRIMQDGIRKPNTNESFFRETLIRVKFYNAMVNEVNRCLASIPFLMVSFKFIAIVSAFSYVAIYDCVFSPAFVLNSTGLIFPFTSLMLHYAIHWSCDASDIMKQYRIDVVGILESIQNPTVTGVQAPCLKWYLEIEPIAQMSMGNVFDTNRSFLLSFTEAILPFTVMIVTTTRSFVPLNNKSVNPTGYSNHTTKMI